MAYIPMQGDIIYIEFNPQAGHEQKGKRPALVVSGICQVSCRIKHFL